SPLPRQRSWLGQAPKPSVEAPSGKPLLRWDLIRGPYGKFLAAYLIFHIAIFMAIPLQPILTVRVLKLSDRAISIGPILTYGILCLTSLVISRYSSRIANLPLVMISVTLYGMQSLFLLLAQGADIWYWASALS